MQLHCFNRKIFEMSYFRSLLVSKSSQIYLIKSLNLSRSVSPNMERLLQYCITKTSLLQSIDLSLHSLSSKDWQPMQSLEIYSHLGERKREMLFFQG